MRGRRDDGDLAQRLGELAYRHDGVDAVGRGRSGGTGAVRRGLVVAADEIGDGTDASAESEACDHMPRMVRHADQHLARLEAQGHGRRQKLLHVGEPLPVGERPRR